MKRNRKSGAMTRRERNDHLTNWYMITLCWGITGILALLAVQHGYATPSTLLYMQPILWILTGVLALLAVGLFLFAKSKNSVRANHYGWFVGVCALVALWLALYNKLRPILESFLRNILGHPEFTLTSFWNTRIPIIGIAVYLILGLIYFVCKVVKE